MASSRILFAAFLVAVIIRRVDARPMAQVTDPTAVPGNQNHGIPDTGSGSPLTAPGSVTPTDRVVMPTIMPGTYLDSGAIIGIVISVLFLLIFVVILCVVAHRLTQTRTKVALMKKRAKDRAYIRAFKSGTRNDEDHDPVGDESARSPCVGNSRRGRPRQDRDHEMDHLPPRAHLSAAGTRASDDERRRLSLPGRRSSPARASARGEERRDSHTGLSRLREISPGGSARGELRNSRNVPIPPGARSNSISTAASSNNSRRTNPDVPVRLFSVDSGVKSNRR